MLVEDADLVEEGIIAAIAEATTKTVARVRVGAGGGRHGCVEKLADYSIVGPVVSVNRHASCRFVVLLSRRSAAEPPAAPGRIERGASWNSRKRRETSPFFRSSPSNYLYFR